MLYLLFLCDELLTLHMFQHTAFKSASQGQGQSQRHMINVISYHGSVRDYSISSVQCFFAYCPAKYLYICSLCYKQDKIPSNKNAWYLHINSKQKHEMSFFSKFDLMGNVYPIVMKCQKKLSDSAFHGKSLQTLAMEIPQSYSKMAEFSIYQQYFSLALSQWNTVYPIQSHISFIMLWFVWVIS